MNLVPIEELERIFVCPRCKARVTRDDDGYRCSAEPRVVFRSAGRWPVLVDFERSILDEAHVHSTAGASPIARGARAGLKARLREFLFPEDRIAWDNVARFRRELETLTERPRVLVVGGGSVGAGGVGDLYDDAGVEIVAFDIYGSENVQFIADAHSIPLADETVDGVIVQAVLEHVLDPWLVVGEIHRVLRRDGVVYAETPFLQHVHEGPYDFTRFTESGHRWMFKSFRTIDSGVLLGPGRQLQWAMDHATRSLFGSRRAGVVSKSLFFWLRYLDRIARPGFDVDAASAVYFLGRKAETAISPRAIVGHYKGAQRR